MFERKKGGNRFQMMFLIQTSTNLTFFKRNISFNFQHSPLIFAIFTNCASLFQFFCVLICQANYEIFDN